MRRVQVPLQPLLAYILLPYILIRAGQNNGRAPRTGAASEGLGDLAAMIACPTATMRLYAGAARGAVATEERTRARSAGAVLPRRLRVAPAVVATAWRGARRRMRTAAARAWCAAAARGAPLERATTSIHLSRPSMSMGGARAASSSTSTWTWTCSCRRKRTCRGARVGASLWVKRAGGGRHRSCLGEMAGGRQTTGAIPPAGRPRARTAPLNS